MPKKQRIEAKKKTRVEEAADGPQTFEEALAFAIEALGDSAPTFPEEWLAVLNREKDKSSGSY